MVENEGFDVTDEVIVQDLDEVKEQRHLTPATNDVKVKISKASIIENKAKDIKGLKLEVRIVDGIPVQNEDTGDMEIKYVNKPEFTSVMDLCFWANPETRNSKWFKNRQHLLQFSKFIKALGLDMKEVRVNDDFLESLIGQELLVNIIHEERTIKDEEGKRIGTGIFDSRLKEWKKIV